MGTTNYLLEIAPEDRCPSYMVFMRVLQAPTVLMPLIAGSIAELYSFQAAFALPGAGGLGTLLLVYRLDEPRQIDHPAHPADSRLLSFNHLAWPRCLSLAQTGKTRYLNRRCL